VPTFQLSEVLCVRIIIILKIKKTQLVSQTIFKMKHLRLLSTVGAMVVAVAVSAQNKVTLKTPNKPSAKTSTDILRSTWDTAFTAASMLALTRRFQTPTVIATMLLMRSKR